MSLTSEVAHRLHKRRLDTNQLAALLPDFTREQIRTALAQAARRGMVVKVRAGQQGRKGAASLWEGISVTGKPRKPMKRDRPPRVASVFDLANGPTPIPFIAPGRKYEPLGAWLD